MVQLIAFAIGLALLCLEGVTSRFCPPSQTTLATFNSALVPFYAGLTGEPFVAERASLLIQQLESSDADIVCLQEVLPVDVHMQIYQSLKQTYPYILSPVDMTVQFDSQTPACPAANIQEFGACIRTQCPFTDQEQLLPCIPERCGALQSNFTQQCRDCISIYLLAGDITPCVTEPAERYNTTYGLMLLSRKQLKDTVISGFIPQSQFRGYMKATVDDVGTIICTHLSTIFTFNYGGPPVPLQYSSYEEQHFREIQTLFELADNAEFPILMGDFNHGPASSRQTVVYEGPFQYGLMNARGFVSPYVLCDGRCTFCTENPSIAIRGITSSLVIDHIYLLTDSYKGRVISAERFFDGVTTASGVPLSDHYGVKVTLKDVRSNCRWWEERQYYCPAPPSMQPLVLSDLQDSLVRLCVATTENAK